MQKKEQAVLFSGRHLIDMDTSNILELEIKTIIKIHAGLEKRREATTDSLTVEIKELRSNQAKIKNAILRCSQTWRLG